MLNMTPRSVISCILWSTMMLTIIVASTDALKPEIKHKFREPEKRPPIIVTMFFTLLVASPALLLFALWSRSVSLKFESMSLKRMISHGLLLAVLVCYIKFWLGTNMFDTLQYSVPLICGLMYVTS